MAYRAATGKRLWVSRYNGPGNRTDIASAVAVSPDGGAVYVSGGSYGSRATGTGYATVAYRAATGTRMRARRYNGRPAAATPLAASP